MRKHTNSSTEQTRALRKLMRHVIRACNESGFSCEEPPNDLQNALCTINNHHDGHASGRLVICLDQDSKRAQTFLSTDLMVDFPDMVVAESDVLTQSVMQMVAENLNQAQCTAVATEDGCYYTIPNEPLGVFRPCEPAGEAI
ncbi:MAG: hypothetical protein KBD24_01865 [Candidatus Pacebacteria bacterium]|nr:hypothetical protein [Candidatus Paceibacterota bacterium]